MKSLRLLITVLALSGLSSACNQASVPAESVKTDSISAQHTANVPVEIKDTINAQVYNHYLQLKDVLVASDPSKAKTAASELAIALRKLKGSENTAILAEKIAASTDLSEQRTSFTVLSNDLIALFKQTEIASGSIYVQYCPMANEGEGGYWLSSQAEIMNPYYGDEMLHCGEVKETLAKK